MPPARLPGFSAAAPSAGGFAAAAGAGGAAVAFGAAQAAGGAEAVDAPAVPAAALRGFVAGFLGALFFFLEAAIGLKGL